MEYKVRNADFDKIRKDDKRLDDFCSNFPEYFLRSRGVENPQEYICPSKSYENDPEKFKNIKEAKEMLLKHLKANEDGTTSKIHIIVDCDVDGYTSAAIVYCGIFSSRFANSRCVATGSGKNKLRDSLNYGEEVIENIKKDITYSLHTGKQHGISSDITVPEGTNLVIIPDGGTNDVEACKKLKEKGIDILILDHHEIEAENPYACIVNSCDGQYPNKSLSGAGVALRFEQYYLTRFSGVYTKNLAALGNIADNMNMQSLETYLIAKNITECTMEYNTDYKENNLFKTLVESQQYSIGGSLTIEKVQFYIVPMLNALIRMGTMEEKELLFRAFIDDYEEFTKKDGETENIYERAVRLCKNAKARQKKAVDRALPEICYKIESKGLDKLPLIAVDLEDGLNSTLTGLVAMKIAEKYKKPCLLLRKGKENTYSGSGRAPQNSTVKNLKEILEKLDSVKMVKGHQGAFGVEVEENLDKLVQEFGTYLKENNITIETMPVVDFEIDFSKIESNDNCKKCNTVYCLSRAVEEFYGTGIEKISVVIKNIPIHLKAIEFVGKNGMWKYWLYSGMTLINFNNTSMKLNPSDNSNKEGLLTVVGTFSYNEFAREQEQFIVSEYEVEWNNNSEEENDDDEWWG